MNNALKTFLVGFAISISTAILAPMAEAQSVGSVCLMGVPTSIIADLAEKRVTLAELKVTYGSCLDANMYVITSGLVDYISASKTKMTREIKKCAKAAKAIKLKK